MSINDTPYFGLLKNRLNFLNDRQKVLADNVANASTPKFVPKDMDEEAFKGSISSLLPQNNGAGGMKGIAPVSMMTTSSGHIDAQGQQAKYSAIKSPDSETTLDGNSVVLEEQMIKVADARMNYDIAIGLYQKGLQLMRLAAKRPGG